MGLASSFTGVATRTASAGSGSTVRRTAPSVSGRTGCLAVTKKKGPGYEELESIEFLDDTTLRYLDDMSKPPGTHTHEVIIRKGSVFK